MSKLRMVTEYGPLLAFFVANFTLGIMPATGILIGTTIVAVIVSYFSERRVPWLAIVGAVLVGAFGGMALIFEDAFFLKIKPTVASLLFALGLGVGLLLKRHFLKMMLGSVIEMDDRGWGQLTLYWIGVFCVLAAANEWAWRALSTDGWVTFKAFGLTGISLVASLGSAVILKRYLPDEEEGQDG